MVYVQAWERLSDALNRVIAAVGLSIEAAQTDICQAIVDGRVKIQGRLRKHIIRETRNSFAVLDRKDFLITEIKSEDLDWENSRPLKPWMVRHGAPALWGPWELESLMLLRSDVTEALRLDATRGRCARDTRRKTGATRRSRPAGDSAREAIKELYPQGVPSQAAEPNAILCRRVGEHIKKKGFRGVSDDTILRAAGRRK